MYWYGLIDIYVWVDFVFNWWYRVNLMGKFVDKMGLGLCLIVVWIFLCFCYCLCGINGEGIDYVCEW